MKNFTLIVSVAILVFLYSCKEKKSQTVYTKLTTTTFDCFCDTLVKKSGKPLVCEPSAVVFFNNKIYIANDKNMPNSAAVFKASLNNSLQLEDIKYLKDSILIKGRKYEDFSISPNSQFIFLSTGFDRIKAKSDKWDIYNSLYFWHTNQLNEPKLITRKNDTSATSSKFLRKIFSSIIDTKNYKDGVPYFKIEGIAAIPTDTLLFAVREYGQSYENFTYCMKIIAIPYKFENDRIQLKTTATKLIFDYKSNNYKNLISDKEIGISSIEYNKFDKQLYMLTSYELGDSSKDVGAYLWTISLDKLRQNAAPSLALNDNGKPLHFAHKAEGITVVNDSILFVIHDDDRIYGPEKITDKENQFQRKHNQAAYTVLKIRKK